MIKRFFVYLLLLLSFSEIDAQVPGLSGGFFAKTRSAGFSAAPVNYSTVGTQSAGATSASPAIPAGAIGDGLIMAVGTKLRDQGVETPTGWRRLSPEIMDMVESSGGDAGEVRQVLFWKEATTASAGTATVNCSVCVTVNAVIYRFSKSAGANWEVLTVAGSDMTAGTSYSVTSNLSQTSKVDDLLFIVTTTNADAHAYSAQAVTQTGATFTTINAEIGEYPTAVGNQVEQFASLYRVTAASASPAKFVYTATSSGSGAANPFGTTHFVSLRERPTPQILPPSGLRSWVASEAVDLSYTGDGQAIWDGQRTSITSTGTVAGNGFSIGTIGGETVFKYVAHMTDASNYWMRAETSKPTPWQPAWPVGTQLIHEYRVKTPSDAPTVFREWGMLQCHTGTEPGGPWPRNSPIFYYAWSYAGQTGWTAGGSSTGNEFMVVLSTPDPDIRVKFPVTWEANATYQIRTHVKFDYATGDPCLKTWIKKNGGAWVLVIERYDLDTVFQADDIAVHGAPPDVGGVIKNGIYNHMMNSSANVNASIAAGNIGYTLGIAKENLIIQYPSDPDYIADVTDNSNPLYEKVSTD
jgi:hypothetical protein